MKIVHTLWTKPWMKSHGPKKVGSPFPSSMHYWASWAYSCLTAKENYRVEIVTDSDGARIIAALDLPYDSVSTALDNMPDSIDPQLWASSKIYVYGLQNEPFFHIDGDSFVFKKLPYEKTGLLVQCIEDESNVKFDWSYPMGEHVAKNMPYKIDGWDAGVADKKAYCMGIFGGNDLETIKEYSSQAMKMITAFENRQFWDRYHGTSLWPFNVTIEQQSLHCFLLSRGKKVTPLLAPERYAERFSIGKEIGFTHLMSRKKDERQCSRLLERLSTEYPNAMDKVWKLVI